MQGLQVSGTLLCHAGPHRIAFPAVDVAVIDLPALHAGRSRSAGQAFGLPVGASRVLLAPSGETVGVDTLEIDAEVHRVLPLPRVLERCGLNGLLDGTVTSAETGSRKPDPGIFGAALELAGCDPAEALHVGDTAEEDVAGAKAAGIRPLLIDRDGGGGDISSLEEVARYV